MNQYMFTYKYAKENKEILNSIYYKITNNISLSNEDLLWINKEKENILLLSKIKSRVIKKDDSVTTKENDIADTIIKYMHFIKLDETKKGALLSKKTKDYVENYSMLGCYGSKHNDRELMAFEKDDSNKYKFMLVMNKLNEGTHIKGVNGLIWFRALDENSKILFLQQFGRIIFGLDPNKDYAEDERTIAIDLVNNVLRVNMKKGEKKYQDDLELLKNVVEWCKIHNNLLPDINSKDKLESRYSSILKMIQEKYSKYINNEELNYLPTDEKNRILTILELGSVIDLWNTVFDEKITSQKDNLKDIKLDDNIFELTSVLKDFVEIDKEVDTDLKTTFEDILKEIRNYLEEHSGITNYARIDYKMQTTGGKIGRYLSYKKEEIINISDENSDAKYICEYFGWLKKKATIEDILKEIREYLEEHLGITSYQKIDDKMQTTGGKIGNYLSKNKEEIINMSDENSDAKYIYEYFGWLEKKATIEDILKEIRKYLEEHQGITNPRIIDYKMQTTGGKIGNYLSKNKEEIIKKSDENSDAKYICEYFGWLKKKATIEDILKEIREYLEEHLGITSYQKIDDKMQTTGGKIGNYLSKNKEEIINMSDENSDAKYIYEYFGWLEKKATIEDILKEIRNYLEEHSGITNPKIIDDKMQTTGGKIGNYLSYKKEEIIKMSDENSEAKYICEYFGWLEKKATIEDILKEIKKYLEEHLGITNYAKIDDKMQTTGGKIGNYLSVHKEEIINMSDENSDAKYICEYFNWVMYSDSEYNPYDDKYKNTQEDIIDDNIK